MTDERRTGKYFKGNGCGLIHIISRHLPEGIEENHGKPQSGYPVLQPRF
jgi:hypothetical protein